MDKDKKVADQPTPKVKVLARRHCSLRAITIEHDKKIKIVIMASFRLDQDRAVDIVIKKPDDVTKDEIFNAMYGKRVEIVPAPPAPASDKKEVGK